jgi:DNA-binding transcriptional regulator PaaX
MNKMRVVLLKIAEGKTLNILTKELSMGESTLRVIVESMVHKGYLKEIKNGASCRMCSMKCSPPFP